MIPEQFKLAYLIPAHKDPIHFNRLVRKLYSEHSYFFVHIDKMSDIKSFKTLVSDLPTQKIQFLKQHFSPWGEIGIIKAEIMALQKVMADDLNFDYIILVSGQDYPIKSNEFIKNFLLENYGKSFINILPMPFQNREVNGMHTLERYYFKLFGKKYVYPPFKKPRKKIDNFINKFLSIYFKKRQIPYNLKPFGGEHWWCFHKKAVKYIIKFLDEHPEYLKFHKYSLCADEMFFHTILGNAADIQIKDNIINDDLRYIDWSEGKDSPKILGINDLPSIQKSPKLFARKFDSEIDNKVLDKIDQIIF